MASTLMAGILARGGSAAGASHVAQGLQDQDVDPAGAAAQARALLVFLRSPPGGQAPLSRRSGQLLELGPQRLVEGHLLLLRGRRQVEPVEVQEATELGARVGVV